MINKPLVKIAIDAAVAAGREILAVYNSDDFQVESKSDHSPLTKADRISHQIIVQSLEKTEIPVLSEEGAAIPFETRKDWEPYWLIDPLDGTKEFIKRNGEFTVNIALVSKGQPVLGVVYVPVSKTLYWGEQFKGSWRQIGDSEAESLPLDFQDKPYKVIASRSHLSAETEDFINKLKELHPSLEMDSSGSSLKLCRVAEGSADAYPRFAPTMEWDTAAADALCRAAGCNVIDVESRNPLRYNKTDLLNPWFLVTRDDKLKDIL